MANLYKLQSELLNDHQITADEVDRIRQHIQQDGQLDYDDITFLVNLLAEATDVCPEFDALFFPAMRDVLLADGQVGPDEQYQLLRMLYSSGRLRDAEKAFIQDLYDSAEVHSPEFRELCETALASPESNWNLGGRQNPPRTR